MNALKSANQLQDKALEIRLFAKGAAILADTIVSLGTPHGATPDLVPIIVAAMADRAARLASDLAAEIELAGGQA